MGIRARETPEGDVRLAAERVALACKALSTAANDLRVAYRRSGAVTVHDAADQVSTETERVCELSEELVKLSRELAHRPLASPARES